MSKTVSVLTIIFVTATVSESQQILNLLNTNFNKLFGIKGENDAQNNRNLDEVSGRDQGNRQLKSNPAALPDVNDPPHGLETRIQQELQYNRNEPQSSLLQSQYSEIARKRHPNPSKTDDSLRADGIPRLYHEPDPMETGIKHVYIENGLDGSRTSAQQSKKIVKRMAQQEKKATKDKKLKRARDKKRRKRRKLLKYLRKEGKIPKKKGDGGKNKEKRVYKRYRKGNSTHSFRNRTQPTKRLRMKRVTESPIPDWLPDGGNSTENVTSEQLGRNDISQYDVSVVESSSKESSETTSDSESSSESKSKSVDVDEDDYSDDDESKTEDKNTRHKRHIDSEKQKKKKKIKTIQVNTHKSQRLGHNDISQFDISVVESNSNTTSTELFTDDSDYDISESKSKIEHNLNAKNKDKKEQSEKHLGGKNQNEKDEKKIKTLKVKNKAFTKHTLHTSHRLGHNDVSEFDLGVYEPPSNETSVSSSYVDASSDSKSNNEENMCNINTDKRSNKKERFKKHLAKKKQNEKEKKKLKPNAMKNKVTNNKLLKTNKLQRFNRIRVNPDIVITFKTNFKKRQNKNQHKRLRMKIKPYLYTELNSYSNHELIKKEPLEKIYKMVKLQHGYKLVRIDEDEYASTYHVEHDDKIHRRPKRIHPQLYKKQNPKRMSV